LTYAKGEGELVVHDDPSTGKTLEIAALDLFQDPGAVLEQIGGVARKVTSMRFQAENANQVL
jgi:hypothetical protein